MCSHQGCLMWASRGPLFPFDDAKVRRNPGQAKISPLISHKNALLLTEIKTLCAKTILNS